MCSEGIKYFPLEEYSQALLWNFQMQYVLKNILKATEYRFLDFFRFWIDLYSFDVILCEFLLQAINIL